MNNYDLSLQPNFEDVFSTSNRRNSELIFALAYSETEASNPLPQQYCYNMLTGGATTGVAYDITGSIFGNPDQYSGPQARSQYSNAMWFKFDAEDSRRDATFTSSWQDAAVTQLRGTFTRKFLGGISKASGYRAFDADQPIYRLALAYLSLAEIANMEDNTADVEKYINMIRERAYGENWDAEKYGFKAGSFVENEVAILHEKDKEFVQEGQRWYDVRRMTTVKNGSETDHFVFCNEGHVAYGLTITEFTKEVNDKWENAKTLEVKPLINKSEAFRVLWPLSASDLSGDKELTQTPGYEM